MKGRQAGLSLIELLVALGILGLILGLLFDFFSRGGQVSTQTSVRAELQQDILNAQQLISGRLREAWYVYPPGQTLSLGNTPTSAPAFRRNPLVSPDSAVWTTGTQPILALIVPPLASGVCPPESATTAQKASGAPFCYRFFAYYPVRRATWLSSAVGSTGQPSASHPGFDPDNGEVWVLAEYRKTLYGFAPGDPKPLSVSNGDANLLADYLAPSVATPAAAAYTTAANTYELFSYDLVPGSGGTEVGQVTLRVAAARRSRGTLVRLPDAQGTYTLSVVLGNAGKVAAP